MVNFFEKVKRSAQAFGNKVNRGIASATTVGGKVSSLLKKAEPYVNMGVDLVQATGLTESVPGLNLLIDSAQDLSKKATGAASTIDRLSADANRYQRAANEGRYMDIAKYAGQDIAATRGDAGAAGASTIERREARKLFDELPGVDGLFV